MFFLNNYFYYITIGLQIICVVHCLRKGNPYIWIWIIIFLPLIGCIAYIIMEVLNRKSLQQIQSGMGNIFYSSGKIKKLEKQLQFSDTFNNRILLADAYLSAGDTDKAIAIYETSLTGAFTENEYVLLQLIIAYSQVQRYNDVIKIARKMYNNPAFIRSHKHVLYAMALDKTGEADLAEKEFKMMKGKYSFFEARYQYGMFLLTKHRAHEAQKIFTDLVTEFSYLSSFEKRANRIWFNYAKHELKKMNAPPSIN
ncbi:MAG: hypothetical protein ABI405_07050 [Parafilimonas sp.]